MSRRVGGVWTQRCRRVERRFLGLSAWRVGCSLPSSAWCLRRFPNANLCGLLVRLSWLAVESLLGLSESGTEFVKRKEMRASLEGKIVFIM